MNTTSWSRLWNWAAGKKLKDCASEGLASAFMMRRGGARACYLLGGVVFTKVWARSLDRPSHNETFRISSVACRIVIAVECPSGPDQRDKSGVALVDPVESQ